MTDAGEALRGRRRILVLGPSGAGKSTLAARLGAALGLPVVHLDALYWRAGWRETPDEEWDRRVPELLAADAWVMDGNYHRSLPERLRRADAAVFLDLPPWVCRMRVLKRIASSHGRVRADMAEGCPEKWDWEFVRWVWSWHRDVRPIVAGALDQAPPETAIIRLRTRKEVAGVLHRPAAAPA
jgi:adenylate kinase family enzyme